MSCSSEKVQCFGEKTASIFRIEEECKARNHQKGEGILCDNAEMCKI
jgi:hypothetical protein